MSRQVSVRIPDDLADVLEKASDRMNLKPSEVIRIALREFLRAFPGKRKKPSERVRHLIGSIESGVPDLAEKHRSYLLEMIKNGR